MDTQGLLSRLARLSDIRVTELLRVEVEGGSLPLVAVESAHRPSHPSLRICLAAGIHGDEPAGVEALVRFLEAGQLPAAIHWLALPCLNPTGYASGTRVNAAGIDLNRCCHLDEPPPEITAARRALREYDFDMFVCCHEDSDAEGFYLYEVRHRHVPRLGPALQDAVRPLVALDTRPSIDGRRNRGGILEPQNWRRRKTGWSLGLCEYRRGTRQVLILETPTRLSFEQRVCIHMAALQRLLAELLSRPRLESEMP